MEEAAVFVQAGRGEACGYDTLAAAIGAALLSFFYFKKKSYKELGGITGDTAGFFVTVCEAAAAAAVAVAGYFL